MEERLTSSSAEYLESSCDGNYLIYAPHTPPPPLPPPLPPPFYLLFSSSGMIINHHSFSSYTPDGLNGIEDDTIPKHAVLQQFGQSLHKPCLILHKDPDCSYNSDAVGEKARIEKRRAIVRSSYFQPKIKEKMGEINNNDPTFKEEEKTMLENRKVVMSSYSQPKSVKENKFDKEIDISCENTASQDTSLWKRQLMKRKATAIGSIETVGPYSFS